MSNTNFQIEREIRYDALTPQGEERVSRIAVFQDISTADVYPRGALGYDVTTSQLYVSSGIDWVSIGDPILGSLTQGDLITADGSGTPIALPVGADGLVLTADSGQPSGLNWTAAAGVPALSQGEILSANAGGVATALPIAADGLVLSLDSSEPLGLRWVAGGGLPALAQGELISATAGGVPTAFPVGTDGQTLVLDSTQPLGLSWVDNTVPEIGTGTTPSDTPTSIGSLPIPLDQTCFIDIKVAAYETVANDAAGFQIKALFKNPTGVVSQVGLPDTLDFADPALVGATVVLTPSGGNVDVVVTGITGVSLDWNYNAVLTCV
jgi:hypothetical protein